MPRKKYQTEEERRLARNARDNASRKKREERRAEEGLCPCGKEPAKPGCKYGQICIDKLSQCRSKQYYIYKAAGVCRRCGEDSGGESYCEECKPIVKADKAAFNAKRRANGECIYCHKPPKKAIPGKSYCEEHKAYGRAVARRRYHRNRKKVFDHYGRACICCGQSQLCFLQIDHIDGGGNDHRKQIGQGNIYNWLVKNKFPAGYQPLCCTCNFAKGTAEDGQCPHVHWPPELLAELRAFNTKVAQTINTEKI